MKLLVKLSLVTLAAGAIHSSHAAATALDSNWTNIRFSQTAADSNGRNTAWLASDPIPTFAANGTLAASNDVYSITVPAGFTGTVDLVDLRDSTDVFSLLNFDSGLTSFGITSLPGGNNINTGVGPFDDPDNTFGNPEWSQRSYTFDNSGGASALVQNLQVEWFNTGLSVINNGDAAIRLNVIPEPSSAMLGLLGLLGLFFRRQR